MKRFVSVKIVGFEQTGENAVELILQFVGSTKRFRRLFSLTDAMNKQYRVGKFIQVFVDPDTIDEALSRVSC